MKTILIMMRDDMVRSLLADWLALEGFEVTQASDAIAGLQMAQHHPSEIVLCDLEMLEMNSFTEKLEFYSGYPMEHQIPFVIAISDSKDPAHAFALGADDYLFSGAPLNEFLQLAILKLKQFHPKAKVKPQRQNASSRVLASLLLNQSSPVVSC